MNSRSNHNTSSFRSVPHHHQHDTVLQVSFNSIAHRSFAAMRCQDEIYGTQFLTNSSPVVWICRCWFLTLVPPLPCQCLFHECHLRTVFFLLALPGLPLPSSPPFKNLCWRYYQNIPKKLLNLENFNLRRQFVRYICQSVIDTTIPTMFNIHW